MLRYWLSIIILSSISITLFFVFKTHNIHRPVWIKEYFFTQVNCSTLLEAINPPFEALLIDTYILQSLANNKCYKEERRVRLAIDVLLSSSLRKGHHTKYDIIYYQTPTYKEYLRVYDIELRILPRMHLDVSGNLFIPHNIERFLQYWSRSKFIDCLGLDMRRTTNKPYLPLDKTVQAMSSLVKYLATFDVYPLLNGGTLL
ncbi:hypothetical protein GCK32_019408, partial [Trichostrongylus colubriformis]